MNIRNIHAVPQAAYTDGLKDWARESLSVQDELMREMYMELTKKHDERLINALQEAGFAFDVPADLYAFIKTRCTIAHYDYKPKYCELYVDFNTPEQKLICSWWDNYKVAWHSDMVGGVKVTITFGSDPSEE